MSKRILTLLLTVIITVMPFCNVFGFSKEIVTSLGTMPELDNVLETDFVRRDQFAAIVATVAGVGIVEQKNTQFDDVKSDNIYSGYVQSVTDLQYMSGVGDNKFAPEKYVTGQQVLSVFVKVLGYGGAAEAKGGWFTGYGSIAQSLGMYNHFRVGGEALVTFGDLWELIDAVLDMPVASSTYVGKDGLSEIIYMDNNNPKLINQKLGAYEYAAKVEQIREDTHSIEILITESENNAPYNVGEKLVLSAPLDLNILQYDKLGVNVWITDKNELLFISSDSDYTAKFAVVSSVNGDTSETSKYSVNSLKELMFLDDEEEYEISAGSLDVYLNGERFTGSLALNGRYVRYAMYDEKIVSIEVWDIKEGGLITAINDKEIKYQLYDTELMFADLNTIKQKIVVLNGQYRDIKELRIDTLFDYYLDKENSVLVIFASERKTEDYFLGISDGGIQVGNLILDLSDNVYVSTDGTTYKSKDINKLLGKDVSAYIDVFKKVRYLCPVQLNMDTGEFLGYLMSVAAEKGLKPKKYIVANLDDVAFAKKEYELSRKVTYGDGLIQASVEGTAGSVDGAGLYKFSINSKGEINHIEKMTPFHGFGEATVTLSSIPSYIRNGLVINSLVGQKLYFDKDVRVIAFDKEDKDFRNAAWNDIRATKCDSIKFDFYGRPMSSDVELIFVSGNLQSFRGNEEGIRRGVITNIKHVLMDDGEFGVKITVNDNIEYVLSKEDADAKNLKKNTYIVYNTVHPFGVSNIYIDKAFDLVGNDIYSWDDDGSADVTIETGTVEKIDGDRIYFTDGSCYYLDTNNIAFLRVNGRGDIMSGDGSGDFTNQEICYVLTGGTTPAYEIETVFYIE